jgi:hypothetical protein
MANALCERPNRGKIVKSRNILRAVSTLIVGAGIAVVAPSAANAQAAEFFKCTLAEGATMDQLVASTRAFLETAEAEPTMEGYTVRFLSPVYSTDTSRGVFWWVGVAPSLAALGAANDYWGTEANAEHSSRFRELTDDCESSSAHYLTPVSADNE